MENILSFALNKHLHVPSMWGQSRAPLPSQNGSHQPALLTSSVKLQALYGLQTGDNTCESVGKASCRAPHSFRLILHSDCLTFLPEASKIWRVLHAPPFYTETLGILAVSRGSFDALKMKLP